VSGSSVVAFTDDITMVVVMFHRVGIFISRAWTFSS